MAAPMVLLNMAKNKDGKKKAGQTRSMPLRAIGAGSKEEVGKGQKERAKERRGKEKERAKEKERRKEGKAARQERERARDPSLGHAGTVGVPTSQRITRKRQRQVQGRIRT